MAFGYALLSGRRGAAGFARQDGKNRRVSVRGLQAGERCALYALTREGAALCCRESADAEGRAELQAACPGDLFMEADGEVRLWEGDDGVYLRACAYLSAQAHDGVANEEGRQEQNPLERAQEQEKEQNTETAAEPKAEKIPREEPLAGQEPELIYTLRSPGTGEPVDTLPERA